MDWSALYLSGKLALATAAILAPIGIVLGRVLAWRDFHGKKLLEALLALPLVLPPTVLGYYLLIAMGGTSPLGRAHEWLVGRPLVFTFAGLVVASLIVNLPFAIQPMQRGFEAIGNDVRDAAKCCGMRPWRIFTRIELPLAWSGIASALVLTFAHTLGEFGVVLMVGGNIAGETRTVSVAIYDRVQAFDDRGAGIMAATLLVLSLVAIIAVYATTGRRVLRR
ncbi:MAG TPA: molybdate ABC transporter permease subunit [Casimicrobiaceae bacterium]|nr:molybdate ABC transporter permease subunit [Casimicrobiaceae bacterium]